MTALFIDKFLTELLVDGLDESLPPQRRIGLMVLRDEGDTDSTMTRRSDKGKSLRPDGQLRSLDGQRLLFKWEEKAAGVRLEEAVEDLRCETTSHTRLAFAWAAFPSSIVHMQCDLFNKQVLPCPSCPAGHWLPTAAWPLLTCHAKLQP